MARVAQHNQQLYDSVAGLQDSVSALKSRGEGPGIQLKKFHNTIKRSLIMQFGYQKERLLDVGCGRGGDIAKWIDARLGYVKGFDLSPGSIKEAEERFKYYTLDKFGVPRPHVRLMVDFEVNGDLGTKEFKDALPYNCVTSMFTLHYFFESEATLKQLLHNVSINLKKDGVFFGCVPDGKRVLAALGTKREFQSPFLNITRRFEGGHQSFGSAYTCSIGDTVTNGEEGAGGSLEFLVFRTPLESLAERYGLKPILDYGPLMGDSKGRVPWKDLFEAADQGAVLKHFAPKFLGADASLTQASQLFCAFAFRKVSDYGMERPPACITEKPHVNKKRRLPNSGTNDEFLPPPSFIASSSSSTSIPSNTFATSCSSTNSSCASSTSISSCSSAVPSPPALSPNTLSSSPPADNIPSEKAVLNTVKPKKKTSTTASKPKKPKPHPLFKKRKEQLRKLAPSSQNNESQAQNNESQAQAQNSESPSGEADSHDVDDFASNDDAAE